MIQFFGNQANDDLIRHQAAAVHHAGNELAHLGARRPGLAQHVTGGQLHHLAFVDQTLGLRAFAGTWRAKKYDIDHLAPHRLTCRGGGLAPAFRRH